ncbi:MAG: helix-hairpin-helix domain-containing protein [Flavobacteriales bacterium]
MKKLKSYFDFNKQNRNGVLALLMLLLFFQAGILLYKPKLSQKKTSKEQRVHLVTLQKELESNNDQVHYKKFDPNKIDQEAWMKLGFSEKQAHVILKYRKSLNGFSNLEEIKECFVISDEKFEELEPFIELNPASYQKSIEKKENFYTKTTSKLNPFNPNQLDQKAWVELGFSEKQAHVILKYKKSLGGTFKTKEEIKSCFVISDEKFEELEPFIELNPASYQKSIEKKENFYTKTISKLNPFNPNQLDQKAWVELGFSEKQAHVILKYKKSLGGTFKTKEEIKACFVISDEKFQQIKPYIIFEKQEKTSSDDLNVCSVKDVEAQNITNKKAQRIINYRKALGGFYDWNQLVEIGLSPTDIKHLKIPFKLKTPIIRMNVNKGELYTFKKHPYITQDFLNFLKKSRDKNVKFSSFQEIENQYNKPLNKLLEHYLLY